jgi:PAS domain-containing protein
MGRFHQPALPTGGSNERDWRGSRPENFVLCAPDATTFAGNEENRFAIVIADPAKSRIGLNALLMALPIAGYVTDVHGFFTFYNDAAVEVWGRTPEKGATRWCGSLRLDSPDGPYGAWRGPVGGMPRRGAIELRARGHRRTA